MTSLFSWLPSSSCVIRAEGSFHCSKGGSTAAVKGEEIATYLLAPTRFSSASLGIWTFQRDIKKNKKQSAVTSPAADGLKIDEVVWRDRKLVVWWKRSWSTPFLPRSLNFYPLRTRTKQAFLWQAHTGEAYITLTAVNISCRKGFSIRAFGGATSQGFGNEDLTR